jgi:hypothetical protein
MSWLRFAVPAAAAAVALLLAAAPALAKGDEEEKKNEGGEETKSEGSDPDLPPWAGEAEGQESGEQKKDDGEDDDDEEDDGKNSKNSSKDDDDDEEDDEEAAARKRREARQTAQSKIPSLRKLKGGGAFGLGFSLGSSNGVSIKIWPKRAHGIVLDIGTPPLVLNTAVVRLSYRFHGAPIRVPDSPVALHGNVGPVVRGRIAFYGSGAYVELAGGLAAGLSVTVAKVPAELFFEVAPMFGAAVNIPGVGIGFNVDGLAGARFYFGS